MTHLPTLSKALLAGMDVESVTRELQTRSKAARGRARSPGPDSDPAPSDSSLASSVELHRHSHDVGSDVHSATGGSSSGMMGPPSGVGPSDDASSQAGQSWVHEFNSQLGSSTAGPSTEQSITLQIPSPSQQTRDLSIGSPRSSAAAYLSDSMMSDSIASTSASRGGRDFSQAVSPAYSPPMIFLKIVGNSANRRSAKLSCLH